MSNVHSATDMAPTRRTPFSFAGANRTWLRVGILGIGLLLLSRDLTGPFTGRHEFNSAMYSIFARNHLRYGLSYTKLFCTWGEGPTPPAEPHRYLNHPPLISVWTAGAMALLGEHEWVARLVPIAATLGSAALLMTIAGRLVSPALGVLAGFFYLTLPIVSYFGRMLDHVALVQFFSLLMLHGYLQWSGCYGVGRSRKAGAAWYTLGAVLGIGTGWAIVIMAAIIAVLHAAIRLRAHLQRRRPAEHAETTAPPAIPPLARGGFGGVLAPPLWALILIPATALTAVLLHILWGFEWDLLALHDLFLSRTNESTTAPGLQTGWLHIQWRYLLQNYCWGGVVAVVLWSGFVAASVLRSGKGKQGRPVGSIESALGNHFALTIFMLIGLHGLIYVALFPGRALHHEYWQYFAAPFVAVTLASLVILVPTAFASKAPKVAIVAAMLLAAAPLPGFMFGRDHYYRDVQMPARFIEPFVRLTELVPPGSPVMTSRCWPECSETFGRYANRWGIAQILYYADRPLIYSREVDEIVANRSGCSAYVLEWTDAPEMQQLANALEARYRAFRAGEDHVIFLLNQRPSNEPAK